jgi:para-aminobenzoate synthetase / 4-amino-4-deoxychorismate lyase
MDAPLTPDPAQGVFETLLVVGGEPIELGTHLDRLSSSLEALFAAELPAELGDEVRERAHGVRLGRLRVAVAPGGAGTRAVLAVEDVDPADFFPAWVRGAHLRSHVYAGGLGRHKWADRAPLQQLATATALPLLLDRGDEVLEASRANVFVAVGQTLVTPAADGRILPGIARAGAIAVARDAGIEVLERALPRTELLAADEVFLTGSVRGVEPVRSLDGTPLPVAGELSRRVGAGLRRRWSAAPVAAAAPTPAAVPSPGPPAR